MAGKVTRRKDAGPIEFTIVVPAGRALELKAAAEEEESTPNS